MLRAFSACISATIGIFAESIDPKKLKIEDLFKKFGHS